MYIEIDGLKLNYRLSGQGKDLILLHGWGANMATMNPLHQHFARYFKTYSLDLPGFGESDPPREPWSVADYAGIVGKFLDKLQIENPIIMGHSFGGKTALYLATSGRQIHKMILIDSSGIRAKRGLKYYAKVYGFKTARKLAELPGIKTVFKERIEEFKNRQGSEDYRNAQGVMRQTLVRVVNEDLTGILPQVKVSTLLIWGENDTATPVSDGKTMERLIPDSGLVILKNAGHYSYLDKLNDFLLITGTFLKEDMVKHDG